MAEHERPSPSSPSTRPGFVFGLLLGLCLGFAVGVMVEKKGCPPVPVPGATANGGAEAGR